MRSRSVRSPVHQREELHLAVAPGDAREASAATSPRSKTVQDGPRRDTTRRGSGSRRMPSAIACDVGTSSWMSSSVRKRPTSNVTVPFSHEKTE